MTPPPTNRLTANALETFLHESIPLTRAMGVSVAENNRHRLVLEAPLELNINHLDTAFGGSLQTLATLACYAGLWTLLRENGITGHVVVKRSQALFRTPVKGRLRAVWEVPPAPVVTEFLRNLQRHKMARMELASMIEDPEGQAAVEFTGSFVALV
jgi:thioesterase domain-containing protein